LVTSAIDILLKSVLKVLILHNRYRQPGGEERSVAETAALLAERGHRVEVLERTSAALAGVRGKLRAGAGMIAGGLVPDAVERAARAMRADVVHAHNIHPLLGERALAAGRASGAAVVMHLHNYRLFCSIAIGYRDGAVCTRCRGRNTLPGIRLRCRGNVPEALAYGAGLARQQRPVIAAVDRFLVPSRFAARRLEQLGLHGYRMEVLPNFLRDDGFAAAPAHGSEFALFTGRLAEEKGADTAIAASAASEFPLVIAGAGPDEQRLRDLATRLGAPVRFLGHLPATELAALRHRAAFAVAPSRWDEPCPYSVIEAMAAGVPVLAAKSGGLPEMVGDDSVLPPADQPAWATAFGRLASDEALRRERGAAALARARAIFGAERFHDDLLRVYGEAVARRSRTLAPVSA
jgi:glycosyltransferase involved in cell wall biosynthesis